ncbi:hypothetical protein Plhal703r1_c17g0078751 [Plasmopara halstedii]
MDSHNLNAGGTIADTINPFHPPLTTIPATTSSIASLNNLQVTVGSIPIWNNPISFGYDLFVQEMSKSGVDGGLDDLTSAGLLSQRLWESLYCFIAVDSGRHLPSEDGAQKSIVISNTSNCAYPLTIYYHLWREVVAINIALTDTVTGPNCEVVDAVDPPKAYRDPPTSNVIETVPETCKIGLGEDTPIPTLPADVIVILRELPVIITKDSVHVCTIC